MQCASPLKLATAGILLMHDFGIDACRCFDLYEWSIKARACGAVVFSTLQSGLPETGQLSALLDNMTTIYTGSGTLPAANCSDKVSTPFLKVLA